ncbi:MAG: hypothetical protein Q7J57_10025 [Gemmobacter sp.]|nr:hypothetical protein [Gemmobacter sp.]
MKRLALAAFSAAMILPGLSAVARADQVSDAIASALEAYNAGDVQFAMDELTMAQQLLQAQKAERLTGFLPEAPDGWTRTMNTDMNTGLGMMGAGTGAEATYEGPEASFRITLMADNPMVASMGALLGNSALMATMGKVVRVGQVRVLQQENSLQTLVGNRVMVQAQDAAPDIMMPVFEKIDFVGLEKFGS